MALLVNYEGVYTAPQKLWYLVDGVWKEVINVFESSVQQEIALIDEARINQDKTVLSLGTKIDLLKAQLDGSDPTIPQITNQTDIDKINEELHILQLQLEVARLEQVAITKQLFEQKAQMEYKKLVMEGELAFEKISNIVDSVSNWGVIRIDPQGPLDERLEVAIQHNLPTNERIFNYGAVYYRLYKLDQVAIEDNILDLSQNFKRRLAKQDYLDNTLNTNYVMSLMTIQAVFNEVSSFVSGGAQRILDYLWALQEQQKYILDNMETVKSNLLELEDLAETSTLITKDENGMILTNSTIVEQVKPLGKILLDSQGATSFLELISTEVVNGITTGSIDVNTYPNYTTYVDNNEAIDEKVEAITTFKSSNDQFITDIKTGVITFNNINIIQSRTESVNYSKNLFWQKQLGNTTLSKSSGGSTIYVQGYTSSGTFKFKSDNLVTLAANNIRIINALMANTKMSNHSVAIGIGDGIYRVIQVMDANTVLVTPEVITETNSPAIVSAENVNTKEINIDPFVMVNDKAQPHHAVPVVMNNNSGVVPDMIDINAYHPVINSIFYPNTNEFPVGTFTKASSLSYENALMVYQLNKNAILNTEPFKFNVQSVEPNRVDFIINQVDFIPEVMNFNVQSVSLEKVDFIINQVEEVEVPIVFNIFSVSEDRLGNIINQIENMEPEFVNFNVQQITAVDSLSNLALNGYNDSFMDEVPTIDTSISGIEVLTFSDESFYYNVLAIQEKYISEHLSDTAALNQIIITSQTGLQIEENFIDNINKESVSGPKLILPRTIKIFDMNKVVDTINTVKTNTIKITTMVKTNIIEPNSNEKINKVGQGVNGISTQKTTSITNINNDYINKETNSIPSIGYQINPGITISA